MINLEKRLYTAVATATGGRDGRTKSDDGLLDLSITPPKALGGAGTGTNPEQLFAAGYAACFGSAVGAVARAKKITTGTVTITAKVTLGSIPNRRQTRRRPSTRRPALHHHRMTSHRVRHSD